ncbi:related to Presequence translocated-associated motor subunit PAM17, mitochondrial [Saccharomycodes ludwigii]|uniref:Presequence translocated-associated motor subunit PAM17 n=1 Tax=Saccharomycodes ludwigii TaxID=36035 RepID=A0A376B2Q4_9ASCO|nr:hypothetical protein SCDLUD_002598 [Saccharomycodes ludwigii]KAH3901118.1 hypothetical protein SCDLUD_002598 [Saccharomycodes ludwigii]SSD58764.1 related to Presequence translocated-associated motor subunit PAM17, mitochondrial [Saccharomycodes ludwigii]
MLTRNILIKNSPAITTTRTVLFNNLLLKRNLSSTHITNTNQITEEHIKDSKNLTWSEFFNLRKSERRLNMGSSIFTAFIGSNLSWSYISTMEIDPTQTILGFDPLLVIVAGIMSCAGLGFLCGPVLGTMLFNFKNSNNLKSYSAKNKIFLEHVIKNRVDASSQSFSNPVPDYYGEKIGSLVEYRQWLRDCHTYRNKAKEFI